VVGWASRPPAVELPPLSGRDAQLALSEVEGHGVSRLHSGTGLRVPVRALTDGGVGGTTAAESGSAL
jgi:hypothetical protein